MGLITQRLHIPPNAFGVLDGRGDTSSTDPVLTWAPVPSYLQKLEGTPFSVDITIYLTSTSADPKTYTLVSGTWPTGWSISSDGTISYNGTGVGAASIQIKASQDTTSADSQTFTVESIAVAETDSLAPTIPVGVALSSKTTTTITATCDAPADVSAAAAVPYTGLKEVRWFKGGVFDGVSATSAGLSLRLAQTSLSSGAGGRKFRGGHYVALSDSQTWSGKPYNGGTYTGIPNATTLSNTGPVTTDTAGLVLRRRWSALENVQNTYTLTSISTALTQLAALSLLQDPTGATHILLFVIPEIRTFTGTGNGLLGADNDNPMPAYLTSVADGGTGTTTYASTFSTSSDGWQGWRWHATFQTRFQALCAEIGRQFDSHANFGGIATQETSNGSTTDGGYTVASYVQALKNEGDYIANGCPTSRQMFYGNFLHAGGLANLLDVATYIQPLGAIFGGPDLVVTGSITTACYPNYTKYHNGTGGVPAAGPTFCSVQQSEWTANNVPAGQAYMTDLYNYATSSFTYKAVNNGTDHTASPLDLDIIVWNWQTSAAAGNHNQQYNSDATSIIHAHPTFGTFVSGSTSTFVEGTLAQSGVNYTVASLGSGIGSTGDEWTLGRGTITGDATITAKLSGISGTTLTSAFAGISFREIDTPGSKAVHLITSTTGIASKYRSIADAGATTISSAATPVVSTTCYLKINRATNLFSFYYSLDGLAWTALGSISLTLASSIFAEVFAGSGTTTSITASFNNVCIQNLTAPTYTFSGLTASTSYSLTAVGRDIAGNDSAASGTLSVTTSSAAVPAYALRSVGTEAHGTSATCGAPAGVVAGDLLLLRADCRNNGDTFTTPTGWTKVSPNTTVTWSALYARIATGTAADNPPLMASSGANAIICQMACFSGSVYTTLASIGHASNDKHGTNTDIIYDALTVSLDNCLIIAWGAHNKTTTSNGAVVTALAGFTEIGQQAPNGSSLSSWWGYKLQTTATNLSSATQTRTGTGESLQYTSLYIALRTS